jgi:hypothetical protein
MRLCCELKPSLFLVIERRILQWNSRAAERRIAGAVRYFATLAPCTFERDERPCHRDVNAIDPGRKALDRQQPAEPAASRRRWRNDDFIAIARRDHLRWRRACLLMRRDVSLLG